MKGIDTDSSTEIVPVPGRRLIHGKPKYLGKCFSMRLNGGSLFRVTLSSHSSVVDLKRVKQALNVISAVQLSFKMAWAVWGKAYDTEYLNPSRNDMTSYEYEKIIQGMCIMKTLRN